MLIDLTLPVSPAVRKQAGEVEDTVRFGHLGTHFDVMDKEFPLDYLRRPAVVLDVSGVCGRDLEAADLSLDLVRPGMFVALRSGFTAGAPYGSQRYFKEHPQLSHALIDALLDKGVSIIGVDFAGIRRGAEHTPADQRCADRGTFVVENLVGLEELLNGKEYAFFTAHTYPVRFTGVTGLPCRVVAEI